MIHAHVMQDFCFEVKYPSDLHNEKDIFQENGALINFSEKKMMKLSVEFI